MEGSALLAGLSPAQAEAVSLAVAAPLAVIAGPGSGKTRVLTRRVAYRCQAGDATPAHTLVVTFSRRAADEMKVRLGRLGIPVGSRHGGVVAGTFHSLAYAALSDHRAARGRAPLAVLGRPARLLRPILSDLLGRAPTLDEIGLVAGGRGSPWDEARTLYARAKNSRGVLDLDDLLSEYARLLIDDRDAGQAARWRHRHVYVDEYQDLNPAHRTLLQAWMQGRPDLCVVGDPGQAIYGFNGASADVLLDFPEVQVLRLQDNFRSSPEIVAIAAALNPSPGRSRGSPGPIPSLLGCADEATEAAAVAAAIADRRVPGRGWSGLAVLARTNARLRLVATALDRLQVPWRLRDPRPLADRPGVQAVLESLPGSAPAADVLDALLDPLDVELLAPALSEYREGHPGGTVGGFATWLDASGITAHEGDPTGVELATFHRAKGLEWPSVWVVGVEEGLVPLTGGDVAEEQRLLYVALTRAAEELSVSWSERLRPSRWIPDLQAARAALAASPPRAVQRQRLAGLLETLRAS